MSWAPLVAPDSLSRLRVLSDVARILRERLARLEPAARPRIVHGDLRRRNVLIDDAGRPRLLDADHLALGDLEWDLAAWAADVSGSSRESVRAAAEEFAELDGVDRDRLALYAEVWRAFLDLAEIEQRGRA